MSVYDKYKAVIGLECHIQLLTKTKMYSNDLAEYGAMPNTNVSVIYLTCKFYCNFFNLFLIPLEFR